VGEDWLQMPNSYFGGAAPNAIIDRGHTYLVRNSLHIIKHIGCS
jgi:hypothetical protein